MAKPFPNHPNLVGGFAPIQMECDAPDLIVKGEVPKELHGAFFRNGPNPQFAPRGGHHWFGGDGWYGFICTTARCRTERVRTVKKVEHDAGEALFAAFNRWSRTRAQGCRPTDRKHQHRWHAGKLLSRRSACNSSSIRSRCDRSTVDFEGKLIGPMTAHPKIDPETGEMVFFGYNASGLISADMSFHVASAR
jgi:carotenoid cleavage dioxygenase